MSKFQRKEVTFRHWFNRKFGSYELDSEARKKYVLPTIYSKLDRMFKLDFVGYDVTLNSIKKYAIGIREEVRDKGTYELPRMIEDIDMSIVEPFESNIKPKIDVKEAPEPEPFKYETFKMDDMEDIPPKLHRTGEIVDLIDSTYTDKGGLYGGTVTIITGESGSGKTTFEIDKLTKYKKVNPDSKLLYISTEMTQGDLRFYKMTLPAIGSIDTLLVMNFMLKHQTKQVIEHAFKLGYDIIVLDSLQDLIGKLSDDEGMRPSEAQRFIIELMIYSAEKKGTAVRAIQHLTKGGVYVGSTLLKHTTTAMFELKLDNHNNRYGFYSKNRRGGDMQFKYIYFNIDKDKKEVVYDVEKFNQMMNAERLAKEEAEKKQKSMDEFLDIVEKAKKKAEEGQDSDTASELHVDDLPHPENEPPLEFGDVEDATIDQPDNVEANENINRASEVINEIAETVEFEETID